MKIVAACDSFKGCLTAQAVCNAIEAGVLAQCPQARVYSAPMADGGEGTVRCFYENCGGELLQKTVSGVFFAPVSAEFAVLPDKTAVIETAAASGIMTADKNKLNPMQATTYGTGELIKAAVQSGARRIVVGLGGSATNDGGMGALTAMGLVFADAKGNPLRPVGENLIRVAEIRETEAFKSFGDAEFTLACDVENPFYGETGAAYVFAPQKGANEEMVRQLDAGLQNFAQVIKAYNGVDLQQIKGTGAAGGLAGGLLAVLHCKMNSGFSVLCEAARLEEQIRQADLIITGEGRTDRQTAFGKLPKRVCALAEKHGVPCILLSGDIASDVNVQALGFQKGYCIRTAEMPLAYAMAHAEVLLREKAASIVREWMK